MAKNTTATGSVIDGVTVVHPDNMGKGIKWNDTTKKYEVNVKAGSGSGSGIVINDNGELEVKFSSDPSTLQQQIAALEQAKQAAEAKDNALQEALKQEEAKVTILEGKVTALENRKDLHASGLRLDDATNEVVLTVEGGQELRVGLGKFMNVIPTSQAVWNEIKVLPAFKADLLAVLKGEEVKDFAGETKGFLLPSA